MNEKKYNNKTSAINQDHSEVLELKKSIEKINIDFLEKDNAKEDMLDLSRKLDNIVLKYMFIEKNLKSKVKIKGDKMKET